MRLKDLMDQKKSLLKHWKEQKQLCLLLSLCYHQKVQRFSIVRELIVNIICALLKLFSGYFLILVIVGKVQIARCSRKLGNLETCIEQLNEIRKLDEANMPDSRRRLCDGQCSFASVNVLFLRFCFN